jgi:hypothetical protein
MKQNFSIEKLNGRWMVNGKHFIDLSDSEKLLLDEFISEAKQKEENQNNQSDG